MSAARGMRATHAGRPDPNDRLGIALSLSAATGLGLAIAVSRFAYQGGTNGLTIATTRSCLLTLGLWGLCLATRRRVRLPLRDWLHCTGLGALVCVVFYGNVASVQFIPVGLAALLVYTYPPLVAVIEALVLRRAPALAKAGALLLAFAGLVLMLGVSLGPGAADARGVCLALAASTATAWNSVWLARRVLHVDILVTTFHMCVAASIVLVAVTLGTGGYVLPATPGGWGGLVGVIALQCASVPTFFAAISRVGAVKSAMLSNVQPLTSIVAAFVLYGELLSPVQLAGGAMVLGGIWLMQWHDARERARRIATG